MTRSRDGDALRRFRGRLGALARGDEPAVAVVLFELATDDAGALRALGLRIRDDLAGLDALHYLGRGVFAAAVAAAASSVRLDAAWIVTDFDAADAGAAAELRASAGIACLGSAGAPAAAPGDAAASAIETARRALRRARARGGGRVELHDDEQRTRLRERAQRLRALRAAVSEGGIGVHYQPIVRLEDGEIVAFEALARWHTPGGIVMPGGFIPLAEESGLIGDLAEAVLWRACRDAAAWQRGSVGSAPVVSVNVSALQLRVAGLADVVRAALAASLLSPRRLQLEVTETSVMQDLGVARRELGRLADLGVRIALDDFGAGYSSLSYLHDLPIDTIKTDRSFLRGSGGGDLAPDGALVLRSVVDLAAALGRTLVVEGIERHGQLLAVQRLGGGIGQGFLFGAPHPLASVLDVLSRTRYAVPFGNGPFPTTEPQRFPAGDETVNEPVPVPARPRPGGIN